MLRSSWDKGIIFVCVTGSDGLYAFLSHGVPSIYCRPTIIYSPIWVFCILSLLSIVSTSLSAHARCVGKGNRRSQQQSIFIVALHQMEMGHKLSVLLSTPSPQCLPGLLPMTMRCYAHSRTKLPSLLERNICPPQKKQTSRTTTAAFGKHFRNRFACHNHFTTNMTLPSAGAGGLLTLSFRA